MVDRIVIDTGPLVAFARADVLEIVGQLPFKFVCPAEVREELDEGARAGYVDVRTAWLDVVPLTTSLSALGRAALDPGEAAVIQLAVEQAIRVVCLDDRKGRRAAMAAGLGVTGSLGLLVRAKTLGLLPALRPILVRAVNEGVWYDSELVRRVLVLVAVEKGPFWRDHLCPRWI